VKIRHSVFAQTLPWALAVLGLVILMGASASAQHFQVTITNLTSAQTFTPIMAASHKEGVTVFTLAQPASTEIEEMAEAGDLSALETTLKANPDVLSVVDSGAVLPPGKSVTLTVDTHGRFNHVSVTAMLIPTNDGFFAVNAELGPVGPERTVTYFSPAYDAGTEADDELCAHIPGPPTVCSGEGFNPSREGDVNFVHIHSGIHGVGDLSEATYDWRNPVAKIVISRVP
jgi:Spondin_N